MSRLSFRPRPLDINKKLPILKSIKDFEDDDSQTNTRNLILRLASEATENEVFELNPCSFMLYCIAWTICDINLHA